MFDSLIETRRVQTSSQRLNLLPLVILLHVAVLSVIIIHKFLEVPEITEPPVQVMFAQLAAPPPPPPPPPPRATATPETPKPKVEEPKPQEVVQPTVTQPVSPPDTTVDTGGASPAGVDGGETGGEVGGVPGGVPGGIPGGEVGGEGAGGPLHIGGDVSAPVIISQIKPTYPSIARSAHVEGVVILEAVIHRDGTVGEIKVVQGVGMGLTEAAVEAVKQWRYKPGLQHGVAVDVYMKVRVRFELSQ